MTRRSLLALLIVGIASGSGQGQSPPDARAVVARAIAAHGGADALIQSRGARLTSRGVLHAPGRDLLCVTNQVYHVPGRSKTTLQIGTPDGGRPMTFVQIIDGERYALTTDGEKRDLSPNALEELRSAVYVQWLWQLTPLLAPGVSLELRPATTYRDRPADCLLVRRNGCPDVTMWFDRESGLLVKLQRPGFGSTGVACTIEQTYGNFRTFGGVVRPTRTVVAQDGVVVLESDVTEYQPLTDVDSSEFTGP